MAGAFFEQQTRVCEVGRDGPVNVCLWPKADIETESKVVFLYGCFNRFHWAGFHLILGHLPA